MARRKQQDDDILIDVAETVEQAQSVYEKNQKSILIAGGAILALVVGFVVYTTFIKAPKETTAMEQMFQAQYQFERDSFARALTNPGGGYLGFLDIIDQYGSTGAGNLANYYAGVSYLHLGQYEVAIDYLESFSPGGEITPIMKNGVLGDAYSELLDFDKAKSFYQKAGNAGKIDVLSAYYLKKLGMLNEKTGDYSAALQAYETIKENYPNSPIGLDIDKYIVRAQGQL